ncbi:taste receptor type 2 member 40-like [Bufo bufo]|uniref:taste receptor type 2 member 40-like n=1 Tax=Bufo bufo TaxID=8384 RepID=UPI001ABE9B6B|nr:taste receptor type 2 member 40-like [Bufo bufo]
MAFIGWILLVIFCILDSGVAFILNMCILVSGARIMRRGQKLNPPDLIQLVIGVVNIALQCLLVYQGLISIFFISLMFVRKFYAPFIVSTLTLIYFTYWLTAWLCIYYCVTITNFNHPVFVWSKRNISVYLPHLLLLSAAGCFFITLPTIWTTSVTISLLSPVNSTRDTIFISGTFNFQPFQLQTASFMGCCLPFLLILVSIILTVSSLLRHVRKMRQKDSGLSQAKDKAHIKAIRTMFQFLFISIIFYINEILFFSMSFNPEDPRIAVCWMIFMSFPAAESLIIVFANPKLRETFVVKFLRFDRKS